MATPRVATAKPKVETKVEAKPQPKVYVVRRRLREAAPATYLDGKGQWVPGAEGAHKFETALAAGKAARGFRALTTVEECDA
jgi:hypothetical protein